MIRWYDVLAARYLGASGNRTEVLAHAVDLETGYVVCGRVAREGLADVHGDFTPDCPACAATLRQWDKFIGAPRLDDQTPALTFSQWYLVRYPKRISQ